MLNSLTTLGPTRQRSLTPKARKPQDSATAPPVELVEFSASQPTTLLAQKPGFLKSLVDRVVHGERWQELQQIKTLHQSANLLKTPADFRAQTAQFKERLAAGESFDSIRAEAYAVASRATQVATSMKPYDCQVLGAIALGSGEIAEMMTGEGKTLTAVMPLYLHGLAGKGAHLVTVNDTLAQRDAQEMGPVFELLGLSVGTVLESMTPEEKRAGYAADVTYTTDRSLGFDYLRDRTARNIDERVQREPFFALVDEVDEVLLDEARTPLIISGPGETASPEYHTFDKIVEKLRPGIDYFVDREDRSAWLSELGLEFVENELYGATLSGKNPDELADYHRKAGALRAEGKAYKALTEHMTQKPGLWQRLTDDTWSDKSEQLSQKYQIASKRSDQFPDPYKLHSPEHEHQVRILNASLKAHALFSEGVDYIVQDQKVKIVDENKGRTSEGRRFNEGLHQALEAKSDVPLRPESRPIASITYPNLFKHYPNLAGMSGTAKTSEAEFQSLYNLSVTKIPTNLQFKTSPNSPEKAPRHNRLDQTDTIFSTKKEKFQAVVDEAIRAYEDGTPVLLGTLSVEANEYLHAQLLKQGVNPASIQVLNAEHVRGDKSLENSIIAQAGRSGMITLATNMAGRGVNIKPDFVNYKKLAMTIERLSATEQKSIVVDVKNEKEAKKLGQWLEGRFAYSVESKESAEDIHSAEGVLIRVAPENEAPGKATVLNSKDFPSGGLYVIGTERSKSRRIDDQLIGRAGRQGKPGKSKFFLSLQDDLIHELAKHDLDSSVRMMTGGKRLESEFTDGLVEKSQGRLAEMELHARKQGNLYDEVLNTQRETLYEMRDAILDPETDLRYKLTEDSKDVVIEQLAQLLDGKSKHSPAEVRSALKQVNKSLQIPLAWQVSESESSEVILSEISMQVEEKLEKAFREFDRSEVKLDDVFRQALLGTLDEEWSTHLESMDLLKQGVQWVTTVGEKPEDAFKRRGFETFNATFEQIKKRSVKENLPQILIGASMLKSERKQLVA